MAVDNLKLLSQKNTRCMFGKLRITDPRMFQSSSFFLLQVCYGNEIKYHIALLVI